MKEQYFIFFRYNTSENVYVRYASDLESANALITAEQERYGAKVEALVKRTQERITTPEGNFVCVLSSDSLPLHEANLRYLSSTNLATNPED